MRRREVLEPGRTRGRRSGAHSLKLHFIFWAALAAFARPLYAALLRIRG